MFQLIETTAGLVKLNVQTGRSWLFKNGVWVRIGYKKGAN